MISSFSLDITIHRPQTV